MHIVIMGCGRVGSSLALELDRRGHSVAIIDQTRDSFRRLGPTFQGQTVLGEGFERDVLERAGIRHADAFAAVSSGDNSNILAARVVRETFGVTNVLARIYDEGRAAVYERLGIPTVAPVRWLTGHMLGRLLPADGPSVDGGAPTAEATPKADAHPPTADADSATPAVDANERPKDE